MNDNRRLTQPQFTLPEKLTTQLQKPTWYQAYMQYLARLAQTAGVKLPTKINVSRWQLDEISSKAAILFQSKTASSKTTTISVSANQIEVVPKQELIAMGGQILSWQQALEKQPQVMKKYLIKGLQEHANNRYWLNNLLHLTAGIVVVLPQKVSMKSLLAELEVKLSITQEMCLRLVIVANSGWQLKILEKLTSASKKLAGNVVVDIVLADDVGCDYWSEDELSSRGAAVVTRSTYLAENARLSEEIGAVNQENNLTFVNAFLLGKGAEANIKAISVVDENTSAMMMRTISRNEHTTGLISQRGVVLRAARLIFNSIGQIDKNAHHANANQENRLLMMSPHARGDANPILLIDDNQVSAGHAASVGQLDLNQLFYLKSRGLPDEVALQLMIKSFLAPVMTTLSNPVVKQNLQETIKKRLTSLKEHGSDEK